MDKFNKIIHEITEMNDYVRTFTTSNIEELESFRINILGKSGIIINLFGSYIKKLDAKEKTIFTESLKKLKFETQAKVDELKLKIHGS